MNPRRCNRETSSNPVMPSSHDGVFAFRATLVRMGATVTVLPDGVSWAVQYKADIEAQVNALINAHEQTQEQK